MSQNPLNLGLRFLLEMAGLVAIGTWGWAQGAGVGRYLLALGLPLVAAVVWALFRVPEEAGGHATVAVPGVVRLLLEAVFFGFAVWGLYDAGATTAAWILGALVLFHYVVSYDRIGAFVRR